MSTIGHLLDKLIKKLSLNSHGEWHSGFVIIYLKEIIIRSLNESASTFTRLRSDSEVLLLY